MLMVSYNNALTLDATAWKQALLPISIGASTEKASRLTSLESIKLKISDPQNLSPIRLTVFDLMVLGGVDVVYVNGALTRIQQRNLENIINESALTYRMVMQKITTHDKSGNIALNGQRVLPNGEIGIETRHNLKYYSGAASEDVRFLHDVAYILESQENQSQP
ncbi:hypothetical protein Tco_1428224 [Tanacetum coccineum]